MLVNSKDDYKQLKQKFLGKSQLNSQDFDQSNDELLEIQIEED